MAVSLDSIQSICKDINWEVGQSYAGLSIHFIIHHQGHMREAIALSEHEIIEHPAANAARAIIRKHKTSERSSFMGLAIANESKMLGFKRTDHLLGLININQDHFADEVEARAQIYHMVWHAIDLYEIRQEPAYKRKFRAGPMVPKRSALNLSKTHLQADVFAGVLSVLKNTDPSQDEGLVKLIVKKRGLMSLTAVADYKAEDYPSVIAIESCEFVLRELMKNPPEIQDHVSIARALSLDVGQAFDEDNIQQWWDFSIPAQDMAWRGFSKSEILGAAINTSHNPFVRSIGYLIQEVTNLDVQPADSLEHSYNAFIDPAILMKLHREMADTIFEDAVTQGLQEESPQAFIDAANKQNEDLTEGRILGWCANALQDAAKAFEKALISGASPVQAARMNYEGNKTEPQWDTLKELGHEIVDKRREGFAVTMGHIAEICHDHPAFAPVLGSMQITMNDPSYVQKLEASNDLAMRPTMPEPRAPTPKAAAPKGPAPQAPNLDLGLSTPAPALSPPGMGGGGQRSAQFMRQKQALAQHLKEQEDARE